VAVLHGVCPHDCPDNCALLVTVDGDGRATHVTGDPAHPITAGFLCGKVSNYLDRVYAEDRLLEPLVRDGPKGEGSFRRASWDDALALVAARLSEAIARYGGETVLPYFYMGAMGFLQHHSMSARLFGALGASELERTICATAGGAGVALTHGVSPEVDPERWPQARHLLCWGWNPMSTAPHLWRQLLAARRAGAKLVVVDPFRSRTARVADEHLRPLPGTDGALALGMMRAIVDAGLQDEDWCRAHTTGYEELLGRLEEYPVERCAGLCGVPAETIARVGCEFASTQPSLLRLGIGAQRHMGAPIAYRTLACLPALAGSWRHEGGGCSYVPTATIAAVAAGEDRMRRPDLLAAPVRRINMSQLGRALTDAALDPRVTALVCWNSNPAAIAPDQTRVLAGLRREDLFTVVLEQFMTDTARHADIVLPATTQLEHLDVVWSWGHHYVGFNRRRSRRAGRPSPTPRSSGCSPPRWASTIPASARATRSCWLSCSPSNPAASSCPSCGRAVGSRSISARVRRRMPMAASARPTASWRSAPTGSPSRASTRCRSSTRLPSSAMRSSHSATRSRS
jgi:anaerobic selenocysteine-containing dehydrogenase